MSVSSLLDLTILTKINETKTITFILQALETICIGPNSIIMLFKLSVKRLYSNIYLYKFLCENLHIIFLKLFIYVCLCVVCVFTLVFHVLEGVSH